MNQKEYNKLLKLSKDNRPKNFFKYRNMAEKILGYKRNHNLVIHHLRDTTEQREFNDRYYERWGIDFDNNMKYCILLTKEEHIRIHRLSDETKSKIAKSVSISKTKLTDEERKNNKKNLCMQYYIKNKDTIKEYKKKYYLEHKEKIQKQTKEYKLLHKDKIKQYNTKWREKKHKSV